MAIANLKKLMVVKGVAKKPSGIAFPINAANNSMTPRARAGPLNKPSPPINEGTPNPTVQAKNIDVPILVSFAKCLSKAAFVAVDSLKATPLRKTPSKSDEPTLAHDHPRKTETNKRRQRYTRSGVTGAVVTVEVFFTQAVFVH